MQGATRVTRQTGQVQTPAVSPDGRELVYLSDTGGHGNLWIARVDGGNQFGASSAAGAEAPASGANGYTIVSADSLADAKALLEGHPHLASGNGARIEVFETIQM